MQFRPKGATTNQPGAPPQVCDHMKREAPSGRHNDMSKPGLMVLGTLTLHVRLAHLQATHVVTPLQGL